jgi:hypothetical protein
MLASTNTSVPPVVCGRACLLCSGPCNQEPVEFPPHSSTLCELTTTIRHNSLRLV